MGIRSTARTWLAGGAAGAVLLLLITWFAIVSPELSSASDLRDQAQSSSDQNAVLERKVATLRTDFANIDSLTTQLAAQRLALPTGSGLPDFTRQLTGQASAAGETLTSITTGEPTLVAVPVATADPAAPTAPAGDSAASTAPVAATDPAATAAGQLLSIPVTVVVDGPLDGHRALLVALQQDGPRRALVGSVVLAPAGGVTTASVDGTTTMTLTLQVFVAPAPAPAAAAATDSAVPTTSATTPG